MKNLSFRRLLVRIAIGAAQDREFEHKRRQQQTDPIWQSRKAECRHLKQQGLRVHLICGGLPRMLSTCQSKYAIVPMHQRRQADAIAR